MLLPEFKSFTIRLISQEAACIQQIDLSLKANEVKKLSVLPTDTTFG